MASVMAASSSAWSRDAPVDKMAEMIEMDAWFKKQAEKAGLSRWLAEASGEAGLDQSAANAATRANGEAYGKIALRLQVEESARRKLSADLTGMRRGMEDMLSKKMPSRTAPALCDMDYQEASKPSASVAGRSRQASELPCQRRLRACACGCGALVMDGVEGFENQVTAMCASRLASEQQSSKSSVDVKAQRAAIERLTRRRSSKDLVASPSSEAKAVMPRRLLDFSRLEALALPREEKTAEELDNDKHVHSNGQPPALPRVQSGPGPCWAVSERPPAGGPALPPPSPLTPRRPEAR